uniref:RRM domain-containing protein n=1 Tax=Meloidogyne javanica TaxID=6303 RepID=A0A915M4M2_MELJA
MKNFAFLNGYDLSSSDSDTSTLSAATQDGSMPCSSNRIDSDKEDQQPPQQNVNGGGRVDEIDNCHCVDLIKEYEDSHKNDKVQIISTKPQRKETRWRKRKFRKSMTDVIAKKQNVDHTARQIPFVEKEDYFLNGEGMVVDTILGFSRFPDNGKMMALVCYLDGQIEYIPVDLLRKNESGKEKYSSFRNSSISEINSWVDAVDQEHSLRETRRTEIMKDGLKIVTDFIENEVNGAKKMSKVVTTYKVITKKVPRVVAERKKWKKFGQSKDDGPGPHINTTYVAVEVELQFLHNKFGEVDDLLMDEKGQATKGMHCRLCKSDEHWSTHCPYKEHFKGNEDSDLADKSAATRIGGGPSQLPRGTYIPPSLRNVGSGAAIGAGKILRSYVARDKIHNKPKGFAFITFAQRNEAENAIQNFNGAKF